MTEGIAFHKLLHRLRRPIDEEHPLDVIGTQKLGTKILVVHDCNR